MLEVHIFIHHAIPELLAAPFGSVCLRLNLLEHLKLFVHFRFLKLINNQSRTSYVHRLRMPPTPILAATSPPPAPTVTAPTAGPFRGRRNRCPERHGKAKALQKLADFRSGAKPATIMHQIVKGYTEAQLDLIATYFAAQK
jgi:hypothetical protein